MTLSGKGRAPQLLESYLQLRRTAQRGRGGGSSAMAVSDGKSTDLPGALKAGIEKLTGIDLSDVRVHENSSQPARLNALAYAFGSDIHLAPGQREHLPHEAWHVVQQRQGRVRPTMKTPDGVAINDDPRLETEASQMGKKALAVGRGVALQRKCEECEEEEEKTRKTSHQLLFDSGPESFKSLGANTPPVGSNIVLQRLSCSRDTLRDLERQKTRLCRAAGTCRGVSNCDTLWRLRQANEDCANKRQEIADTCYSDEDPNSRVARGHAEQVTNKRNAVARCDRKIAHEGCE